MKYKDFEKTITKELLQDKDTKHVYCIRVSKDMIKNNLLKQRLEDIIYTWCYCNGIVIVNYCKC
jgi:hypothetical protein